MVRILVLEDDANLNRMVCTFLNDSGFETTGCLHKMTMNVSLIQTLRF